MSDTEILGGPARVGLEIDAGPDGIRGTNFFLALGDPNLPTTNLVDAAGNPYRINVGGTTTVIQQPLRYDIAFNIDSQHPDYLFVYQYNTAPGTNTIAWIKALRLIPNSNSRNLDATFVDGVATVTTSVPLPPGYDAGPLGVPNRIDIGYEISNKITSGEVEYQNPVAASFKIESVTVESGVATVEISFKATEYFNELWSDLQGLKTIHLVITVV